MKKIIGLFLVSFLAACGTSEPASVDDGGNGGSGGSGGSGGTTTQSLSAFRSPGAYLFDFNAAYVGDEVTGEILGDMPGLTWNSGVTARDSDSDGWLGMSYEVAAGTYTLTYRAGSPVTWADYGEKNNLAAMSSADLAFLQCNWWNSATAAIVPADSPSCAIRVTVSTDGSVTPAGNMANLNKDLL